MKIQRNKPKPLNEKLQKNSRIIQDTGGFPRRSFLTSMGLGAMALGFSQFGCSTTGGKTKEKVIAGFDETIDESDLYKGWEPVSDRKVRVGLVGYGVCKFAAAFGFQDHPNVEVVAVSDLFPDRCAALAERVGCKKNLPFIRENGQG